MLAILCRCQWRIQEFAEGGMDHADLDFHGNVSCVSLLVPSIQSELCSVFLLFFNTKRIRSEHALNAPNTPVLVPEHINGHSYWCNVSSGKEIFWLTQTTFWLHALADATLPLRRWFFQHGYGMEVEFNFRCRGCQISVFLSESELVDVRKDIWLVPTFPWIDNCLHGY